MKEYLSKGRCIWCLMEKPVVTFRNAPHTISRQLGSTNIGFDICDSCNDYFGKQDKTKSYPMSIELAFKEIMSIMQLLLNNNLNEKSYKKFRSIYFEYYHLKKRIRIRRSFALQPYFIRSLTRQFIKGIYEIFLQEYHRVTKNGLEDRFNSVRRFVRNDIGNLPLYFLETTGVYLVEENLMIPSLSFNDKVLSDINDLGFFSMIMFGNVFFLEVTPRAEISREIYLRNESAKFIGNGFFYTELRVMKYITDIDFTLRKLYQG
jgi:hypothetical protein